MPSALPLPTIADFLRASRGALRGEGDTYADVHPGAGYDHFAGPTAILFARETDVDRDIFADTYLQDARGDALTQLIQGRYGTARVLATAGTGVCQFTRANTLSGAGTLLAGTRVQVAGNPPSIYQIAVDTPVAAIQTNAAIPVQSTTLGPGSAITANGGLSLLDPTYDLLWQPQSITCADGTSYEQADTYRARAIAQRLQARNGYVPRLVQVCQTQGATYVVAFSSQYGLTNDDAGFAGDYGLNALYVADANFQSSTSMIQNCAVAIDSARALGADLWVGGISQSLLFVNAVVNLVDSPGNLDVIPIQRACVQALLAYFAGTQSGFTYKRDALAGAMRAAHPAVQQVSQWLSPTKDFTLSPTNFPATLTRWTLLPRYITLQFVGPS